MIEQEANFDGLVGPTHNYAGLSWGNVASNRHAKSMSHPREAALQGLSKMKALADMGLVQGVLAPQARPDTDTLRRLGFAGTDAQVLDSAFREAPHLLAACSSASAMWTANAATVSPGADTLDGRVHFTPANLVNKFHRSIEHEVTGRILRSVFADEAHFCHHQALPAHDDFGDEGAANHTRLHNEQGHGLELFVYGRRAHQPGAPAPRRFPARQTLEASRAVARLHGLSECKTVFIQQNPAVIDQGVFHNDVIAVGNGNVLFYHQQAFLDTQGMQAEVRRKLPDTELHFIEVKNDEVPVADAVKSYLFNTQLVTLKPGHMALIAPTECAGTPSVNAYLERLLAMNTPIREMRFMDVKQSMQNGGGPACLRLRVAMNRAQLNAVNPASLMNDRLYGRLTGWVQRHYRDRLHPNDLRDPALLEESRAALDELTQILELGSVYPFQR